MTLQKPILNKSLLSSLIFSMTLAGCATPKPPQSTDPWSGWNHGAQKFNDKIDQYVLKPVAKGYQFITPKFLNDGITNAFSNVNDIGVTFNDLFQMKLSQGSQDAGRFLINTTAGIGGFVDVANKLDLPKHKEDFGQTLGYWGIPSGNYLILPFWGPSSPRDTAGLIGDAFLNPLTYISIFGSSTVNAITAGTKALDIVDRRDELMTNEKILNEGAVDRYDFLKNSYQQNREYLIKDGREDDTDPDLNDESSYESDHKSSKKIGTGNDGTGTINSGHALKLSTPK